MEMMQHDNNAARISVKSSMSNPSSKSVVPKTPPKPPVSCVIQKAKVVPKEKVGSLRVKQHSEEVKKVVSRSPVRSAVVQQYARPRKPRSEVKKNGEEGLVEIKLRGNFYGRDDLVKNLKLEVLELKAELSKVQALNLELLSSKQILSDDLAAANAKISALSSSNRHQIKNDSVEEHQTPRFKDVQKLIAHKLQQSKASKEGNTGSRTVEISATEPICQLSTDFDLQLNDKANAPAPPPPPPPPQRRPVRAVTTLNPPSFEKFYNSMLKNEGKRESQAPVVCRKPVVTNVHSSIVGEIQSRSSHLLAIKADIQTKGEFIDGLIQKVLASAYTDIEDVVEFVNWLDIQLSSLADERAVLKHFKWPEKKADAMREAAVEYRDLKLMENEIASYEDDFMLPCEAALKKMASLLDKSERSTQRLIRLRSSSMSSYRTFNIPTDWMLDSGIVSKIKHASMKLTKMYVKRVSMELEMIRNSERQSSQEALLLQGLHFAYRAHQFMGELDSETLCALEDIRQRVPGHFMRSRELLVGIPT